MKISAANILMVSSSNAQETLQEREKLTAWMDSGKKPIQEDRVTISQKARSCLENSKPQSGGIEPKRCTENRTFLKELLVEVLTGRRIKLLEISRAEEDATDSERLLIQNGAEDSEETERVGWGLEYAQEKSYSDEEHLVFTTGGVIRTEEGLEIEFSLRLNMDRKYMSHDNLDIRLGDAALKDPLVLNFNGNASALQNATFTFDLDGDGTTEELPLLAPGSGFLVFDRDGNGTITSGQEMFGPQTDNGFSELRAYDEDGNDWIDESDSAFEKLSVWAPDQDGIGPLLSLKEKGVGAIYLGHIETTFHMRGDNHQLEGKVRSTGIFLSETGKPGTVQQLDLAV